MVLGSWRERSRQLGNAYSAVLLAFIHAYIALALFPRMGVFLGFVEYHLGYPLKFHADAQHAFYTPLLFSHS